MCVTLLTGIQEAVDSFLVDVNSELSTQVVDRSTRSHWFLSCV